MTIDDRKAYTKPWSIQVHQALALDTDLIEFVCLENEKDILHLVENEQVRFQKLVRTSMGDPLLLLGAVRDCSVPMDPGGFWEVSGGSALEGRSRVAAIPVESARNLLDTFRRSQDWQAETPGLSG